MHPKIILTNQLLYYKLWEKKQRNRHNNAKDLFIRPTNGGFFLKKNIVNKINNYRNTLAIV